MTFNLFERGTPWPSSALADLKTVGFLQDTLLDAKPLLALLSETAPSREINKRRAFFAELIRTPQLKEIFSSMNYCLNRLQSALKVHSLQSAPMEKAFCAFLVTESYIHAITRCRGALRAITPQSQILAQLHSTLTETAHAAPFIQLQNQTAALRDALQALRDVSILSYVRASEIIGSECFTQAPVPLEETITGFLHEVGIPVPPSAQRNRVSPAVYRKYMAYLLDSSVPLGQLFLTAQAEWQPLISTLHTLRSDDIQIALDVCTLHEALSAKNIPTCFPIPSENGETEINGASDITLCMQNTPIVRNNIFLAVHEKTVFVIGANGGGKTSFLRALGVCGLFGGAGLFVPAENARMPHLRVLTVFPRDENYAVDGRFENELRALREVPAHAEENSLILCNELFSGTDGHTAHAHYRQWLSECEEIGCRVIIVTHFHAVAQEYVSRGCVVLSAQTDENKRPLFKIERLFTATSAVMPLLKKYRLTGEALRERVREKCGD